MTASAITVSVKLPRSLADDAHGRRDLALTLPPRARLVDAIAAIRETAPALARRIVDETGTMRRFVNVYVGDDECRTLQGLDTPLHDGVALFVIGSVAGGGDPEPPRDTRASPRRRPGPRPTRAPRRPPGPDGAARP